MYQGDVKGAAAPRLFLAAPALSQNRSGPGGRPECVLPPALRKVRGPVPPRREQFLPCWCECQGAALFPCTLRRELGWPGCLLQQTGWHWLAPGWAGGPDFGQGPGVILTQPFGHVQHPVRRAGPGAFVGSRGKEALLAARSSLLPSFI